MSEGTRRTKTAVTQPTNRPTPKVAAVGISGAILAVLVFILGQLGVDLPPGVGEAIVVIIVAIVGWLKKDVLDRRWGPPTPPEQA